MAHTSVARHYPKLETYWVVNLLIRRLSFIKNTMTLGVKFADKSERTFSEETLVTIFEPIPLVNPS
jgi:hypothetical protein